MDPVSMVLTLSDLFLDLFCHSYLYDILHKEVKSLFWKYSYLKMKILFQTSKLYLFLYVAVLIFWLWVFNYEDVCQ